MAWLHFFLLEDCVKLSVCSTYELRYYSSMQRACTSSSQIKSQHQNRKWTWDPTPNHEAICHWYPLGKGKPTFSNKVSLSTVTTAQGRPHALSHWPTQSEFNGVLQIPKGLNHWPTKSELNGILQTFSVLFLVWAFFDLLVFCLFGFHLVFLWSGGLWVYLDQQLWKSACLTYWEKHLGERRTNQSTV